MKFRYKKFCSIDGRVVFRPVIPIELIYKNKTQRYEALIDSGADFCIFHADIGSFLGIPIIKGRVEDIGGISGIPARSFIHSIQIGIGGTKIDADVRFSGEIAPFGFGVLGQVGFFDKFVVKFDFQKKVIEIVPKQIKK